MATLGMMYPARGGADEGVLSEARGLHPLGGSVMYNISHGEICCRLVVTRRHRTKRCCHLASCMHSILKVDRNG